MLFYCDCADALALPVIAKLLCPNSACIRALVDFQLCARKANRADKLQLNGLALRLMFCLLLISDRVRPKMQWREVGGSCM